MTHPYSGVSRKHLNVTEEEFLVKKNIYIIIICGGNKMQISLYCEVMG